MHLSIHISTKRREIVFQVNGSRLFWAITYIKDDRMLSTLKGLGFKIFNDPGQAHGVKPWMVIGLPPRWKGVEGDFQTELYDYDDELRFVDFFGFLDFDAAFIDVRRARQKLGNVAQLDTTSLKKSEQIYVLALEVAVVGRPTSNWIS